MDKPKPEITEGERKKHAVRLMALEMATEFAVIIALPLILFILLGKWLDGKFGSKLFILAGLLIALALSSYIIYKRIKTIKNILK